MLKVTIKRTKLQGSVKAMKCGQSSSNSGKTDGGSKSN